MIAWMPATCSCTGTCCGCWQQSIDTPSAGNTTTWTVYSTGNYWDRDFAEIMRDIENGRRHRDFLRGLAPRPASKGVGAFFVALIDDRLAWLARRRARG